MNQPGPDSRPRKRRSRRRQSSGPTSASVGQTRTPAHHRIIRHRNPLTIIASEDELDAIHETSLNILSETGMDFLSDEARNILSSAGAVVDGERVRMGSELVHSALATVPSEFRLHARNPDNDMLIGTDRMYFGSVASAPNASDLDNGRRPGTTVDFQNFLRLIQSLDIIHYTSGYPVEPVDIHPSVRHLKCVSDFVTLTDKVFHAYSLGIERNRDALEIVRIARGIDADQLDVEPSLFTVINSSSPLRLDAPMLTGIIEMSRRGQVVVLTPFTLAGAMAPVAAECRSARGSGAVADGPTRGPLRVRRLYVKRRYAVRFTCVWHSGIHESSGGWRATGQTIRDSIPILERQCC